MSIRARLTTVAAALMLAACGGGEVVTTEVTVVGDSLNDSGTFGFKFTVQGVPATSTRIWTDHVVAATGAPALCPRNIATSGTTVALNPAATSCTSHGVGGGRINVRGTDGDATPFSIVQQLKDVVASGGYRTGELLLVDGGGNDAADLVGSYLALSGDGGTAYTALLGELLTPTQVQTAINGGQTGLAAAGGQYMTALANLLADTLRDQALNKGAQRILIMTAPDVTKTPRFLAVLAGVAAQTDADTAEAVRALAISWVGAFNNQLKARFAGNPRVVVVDFYAELNQWLATPATYGLTNTTKPACPATGTDGSGLPTYSLSTCTSALLSTPSSFPTGVTDPNWWQTYVFSDNFHGTPRTNQLMGQLAIDALEAKGWL